MHALAAYSWCPFLSIDMWALEKPQALDIPIHFYDLFKPQSALGFPFFAIYKIRYMIGALSEHLFRDFFFLVVFKALCERKSTEPFLIFLSQLQGQHYSRCFAEA